MEDINLLNNDIMCIQNNVNITFSTLNKLITGDITKESAINIILSLNNFETIDEITIESAGDDKNSIIRKIKDFLLKLVRTVIGIFITIYKKIRDVYYRLSKQSYKVNSMVNQSAFRYDDDIGNYILKYLYFFNYDNKENPIENFMLFYNNFSKAYDTSSINLKDFYYGYETDENSLKMKINEMFQDFGIKNQYLNILRSKHTKILETNFLPILINPYNDKFIGFSDKKNYELKVVESIKFENEIINSSYCNITYIGKILSTIGNLEKEFKDTEKNITSFLNTLPNELEKSVKSAIDRISENDKQQYNIDINIYISTTNKSFNTIVNMLKIQITNNIMYHTKYIDMFLKIMEILVEKNTTK